MAKQNHPHPDHPGPRLIGTACTAMKNLIILWVLVGLVTTLMIDVVHAATRIERGAYLVKVLASCAGCHTPKAGDGPGPLLSGGTAFGAGIDAVVAPNITPDNATGIGGWSDHQIADAIKTSIRPDGSRIRPPMPQMAYHAMADDDVKAIIAYLRSAAPVIHVVPSTTRGRPEPARPMAVLLPVDARNNPVTRGRYIAVALSHCVECHTPVPLSAPDVMSRLDKGGRLFRTAVGPVEAPGIRADDLQRFSDGALKTIITKGIRPDGSKLEGPMPVKSYAGFRPSDLDDLVAFLRSDQTTWR